MYNEKKETTITSGYGHFGLFWLIMDRGVRIIRKLEIYQFTGIAYNYRKHHHPNNARNISV